MRKQLYKIVYWPTCKDGSGYPNKTLFVVADDADEAMGKIRKREVGKKVPELGDDLKAIPGKFLDKVTAVTLIEAEIVSAIDLV